MSGVNRAIKAEIMADGISSEKEIKAKFSPDAIRSEKGQTIHSPASKKPDAGEYLGKNGKDATPKK